MDAALHKQPSSQGDPVPHVPNACVKLNVSTHNRSSCGRGVTGASLCSNVFLFLMVAVLIFLVAEDRLTLLMPKRSISTGISIATPYNSLPWNKSGVDKVDLNAHDVVRNDTRDSGQQGTPPTMSTAKPLEMCPLVPPNLVGPINISLSAPSYEEMEPEFSNIEVGGTFKPKDCVARHRVAILIPYRNRTEHLKILLYNLHQMLPRQQIDYGIFVIEQDGNDPFNRAKLFNVGYVETLKVYDYQCFIFHDVDHIPEDDRNLYTCPEEPRHMAVSVSKFNYTLAYKMYFGGVSALKKEHMERVNGFSNSYWGWGGEDDDMAYRIKDRRLKITRYPQHIARYTTLGHMQAEPGKDGVTLLRTRRSRYYTDGLNSVKYEIVGNVRHRLYTWISADLKYRQ